MDKRPACQHGFYDAVTDAAGIEKLWRATPGDLIGVPAGIIFDCLDIDAKHSTAHTWWNKHRHDIPATRAHRTRSGGLHILFSANAAVPCSAGKLAPGVDTRGLGGYIIWWPAAGYSVLTDAPLAPWPEWLLAAQQPKPVRQQISSGPTPASIAGIASFVETIPEGQRNCAAYWGLCRAFEAENQGVEGAVAAVTDAALKNGLDRREVATIVRSADRTVNGIAR